MKKIYIYIFIIIFFCLNNVFAQAPTFDMTVRNIQLSGSQQNTLTFEIWLKWTNYGASDRFEFASGQYAWTCNRAILGTANPGITFQRSSNGPGFSSYAPPLNGAVDTLIAPPGKLLLRFAGNNPNSELPPYIVSASGLYGGRIFNATIVNQGGAAFPLVPLNLRFKFGAAPTTIVAYFLPVTAPDTELAPPQLAVGLMDTVVNHYTVENGNLILDSYKIKINLTSLFEGKYDNALNILTKREAVSVYLRNSISPFNIVDSASGIIDSVNFSGLFTFANAPSGQYYIVVKNKQCIETWSKSGGEQLNKNDSTYNYNFTSASSQAYFNNLKLKGSKYCLYSGDVDQNGFINLNDLLSIYNDAYNFIYGNVITDLTGDNLVDLHDMLIASSNMNSFIRVRRP